MQKILAIFLMFFSCQFAFAADDGDWWLQRQITIEKAQNDHAKKVYGTSVRIMRENAPISSSTQQTARDLVRRSIAVDIPTPTKVGTPMLQRIKHVAKTPGVQMVGAYAVMQLIEAIGWVMEDGTYVKKIPLPPDDPYDPSNKYIYSVSSRSSTEASTMQKSCDLEKDYMQDASDRYNWKSKYINAQAKPSTGSWYFDCILTSVYQPTGAVTVSNPLQGQRKLNPKYDPSAPKPDDKTVPLTAPLLGAAMLGQGYNDPDPNFNNDTVNTGNDTGVAESYTHDPSGVGDELADAMDEKLKNAKPTDDGKASYIGDPKYDERPLTDGDTSSDRAWDSDAGQAEGESKPQTDPDTGEATGGQSISIKFPVFCEWASSMCKWYDDWTKFTTEQPELKDEPLEIEDKEIIAYQREDHIQFGQTCPFSPQIKSLPLGVLGSLEFETDLTFICSFGAEARPYVLGIGHLGALIFLLIGLRNGNA